MIRFFVNIFFGIFKRIDWWFSSHSRLITNLEAEVSAEATVKSDPGFKGSFEYLVNVLGCSDGRICVKEVATRLGVAFPRKAGVAGQGVFAPEEDRARLKEWPLKAAFSHEECAAGLKALSLFLDGKESPDCAFTGDFMADSRTFSLAMDMNIKLGKIGRKEFLSRFHNERVLCLDATGRWDPSELKCMPAFFLCSGAGMGLSREYCQHEVNVLTGVALGHHGFGHWFTARDPFYILVAAESEAELASWTELADAAVAEFGDRVVVHGFVAKNK